LESKDLTAEKKETPPQPSASTVAKPQDVLEEQREAPQATAHQGSCFDLLASSSYFLHTEEPKVSDSIHLVPLLEERISLYKKSAVMWKRQGDMAKAREELAVAKQIEAMLSSVHAGDTINESSIPEEPKAAIVVTPAPAPVPESKPTYVPPPVAVEPPQADQQSRKMSEEVLSLSPQAARASRSASLSGSSTSLAKQSSLRRPSTSSSRERVSSNPVINLAPKITSVNHLEDVIKQQIKLATGIAAIYLKQNQKPEALSFHKLKKQLAEHHAMLQTWIAQGKSGIPPISWTSVSYTINNVLEDVSPTDIEVHVVKAIGLQHKEANVNESDTWVKWEWDWPEQGHKQAKGETPMVRGGCNPGKVLMSFDPFFKQ
jgi:hypothetical protein